VTIPAQFSFSKKRLLDGYRILNKLWHKGFFPDDLELHFFLHWFAYCRGNISHAAQALQISRTGMEKHLRRSGLQGSAFTLRHSWLRLSEKNKKAPFETNFFKFYHQAGGKPKLTTEENSRLAKLWQTGFPFKTLLAHYIFWGIRVRKSKPWVQSQVGYTKRNLRRYLSSIRNPETINGFWLAPLKPRPEEFFTRTGRPPGKTPAPRPRVEARGLVVPTARKNNRWH
jgi:hypothetical protein